MQNTREKKIRGQISFYSVQVKIIHYFHMQAAIPYDKCHYNTVQVNQQFFLTFFIHIYHSSITSQYRINTKLV